MGDTTEGGRTGRGSRRGRFCGTGWWITGCRLALAMVWLGVMLGGAAPGWGAAASAEPQSCGPLARRVEAASRRYLGTRYRLMPLGEGSLRLGSPRPLADERHVDCVTFVEQSLAHSLAARPQDYLPLLTHIRYRDGRVRFDARNHCTLADWAPNNGWLVKDVTRAVGGAAVRTTQKTLDRTLPARENGQPRWAARLAADGLPCLLSVTYIPRAAARRAAARFPPAAIVAFVSPGSHMDASHVGFLFRSPRGLTLRHGSSAAGRVVDRPFLPYLARRRGVLGIVLLALREAPRLSVRR